MHENLYLVFGGIYKEVLEREYRQEITLQGGDGWELLRASLYHASLKDGYDRGRPENRAAMEFLMSLSSTPVVSMTANIDAVIRNQAQTVI